MKALRLDLSKNYSAAIREYEAEIKTACIDLDLHINLAFLYWSSSYGSSWSDEFSIEASVRERGYDECMRILCNAMDLFPDKQAEILLWQKYFSHRQNVHP